MKNTLIGLWSLTLACAIPSSALAAPTSVTLAGSLQSELGCPADWQPSCATTFLNKNGNLWSATFTVPAGSWEYKIAIDGAWTENYGAGGAKDGANIAFAITEEKAITFVYDEVTHEISDDSQDGVVAPVEPQPDFVTIAGDLQQESGCPDDWQPECANTQMELNAADKIWRKTLSVPAGSWQFKAALNQGWSENYGANGAAGGSNINLSLSAPQPVTFYYSHKTHWITSNATSVIATAVGNFQSLLGCPGNWQPDCLRTWLQDVDGNGLYTFSTTALPVGTYEAKVAINEKWDESYGDNGNNISFRVDAPNQKVVFTFDAANKKVYIGDEVVAGDLKTAKAHWLTRDTIAVNLPAEQLTGATAHLHFSSDASLSTSPAGVSGGDAIALTYDATGLSDALKNKYPHLKNLAVFKVAAADLARAGDILKQQTAISVNAANGNLLEATALQLAGVLDDVFAYNGNLGVIYSGAVPSVKLWAPTAQKVTLHVFDDANPQSTATPYAMQLDAASGVWTAEGNANWNRKYYLYEVEVFVRHTGKVEKNWTTDPYSLNTSINGKRSQFINLADADLKPAGWDSLAKPVFKSPEDMVIYELHVRDFSIQDETVPAAERGTFAAFTKTNSNGMKHLKRLADAGLSHVHLLPAFDCATINENKSEQKTLTDNLASFAPDSEMQQAAVEAIRGQDGFNWCYDPHHYTVPDGGYATDPDGVVRIREFRSMVAALNKAGLRVIMDVVYNHTSGALLSDTSVLDKVVPGYYHRLNAQGDIERSTCCENTASENVMMEKLMRDSIRTWATAYKVDGFRYDIMGHHTKDNIVSIKNDIQSLTVNADGVDGKSIYFYGEGWNFGEVQNDARFVQARIGNMSGTGVGTFNNFIRDAVRGGGPFDSGIAHIQNQSFINGLYLDPNAENSASAAAKENLLKQTDMLKATLAGSLKEFSLVDYTGKTQKASAIDGAGYTLDPQETINYIEAHDNETLFDMIQYKAPLATSMADRVRMQHLGNALVLFAQGVPFLHAGQEMLRSKSTDRNSYDAGDWFNLLDFTYQQNGWGRGLPLKGDNQQNWNESRLLLANPALKPAPADISTALERTLELLAIRKSSKLFRLETSAQIQEQVKFYNNGANQVPGVIAMLLSDSKANLDPDAEMILVLFNANVTAKTLTLSELKKSDFALHPVQKKSKDKRLNDVKINPAKGEFTVPARSVVVLVSKKKSLGDDAPATPETPGKPGGGSLDAWLCSMLVLLMLPCSRRFTNN
ncbi:pullulanase-type alpha-1,6-glucosidase [Cellvibrio sp. pealriver]|uniref:pullulanase-type alpha-1,6-glucosidase n=1 Tax=Cellvibrio sp. pealriver TaxID=1622269 RepID=UPI00069D84DD|nr:pullulanase-type alpha-1,6-glucosidase [Cellvibrio sp. pealriver]